MITIILNNIWVYKTMKNKYCTVMLFIMSFSLFALGGCGVKPDGVEPPASVQNDSFPNTYPDVSTDPAL